MIRTTIRTSVVALVLCGCVARDSGDDPAILLDEDIELACSQFCEIVIGCGLSGPHAEHVQSCQNAMLKVRDRGEIQCVEANIQWIECIEELTCEELHSDVVYDSCPTPPRSVCPRIE